jgi:hypothetical protein
MFAEVLAAIDPKHCHISRSHVSCRDTSSRIDTESVSWSAGRSKPSTNRATGHLILYHLRTGAKSGAGWTPRPARCRRTSDTALQEYASGLSDEPVVSERGCVGTGVSQTRPQAIGGVLRLAATVLPATV